MQLELLYSAGLRFALSLKQDLIERGESSRGPIEPEISSKEGKHEIILLQINMSGSYLSQQS